ncbi:ATP-dependent Clp protease adaptor ClpS [Gracilimonas sp.]|uniref:ATP-dependent Clp protease adaptor ClpS n=1 Tax=Gracilimonas sp. TaxID=1974203 RepID=UPI0037522A4B
MSESETEELTETKTEEEVEESVNTPWRLILYDDDIHTFDEVISQLMKATGCSLSEAEDKTWKVHNEGKALVHEGEFEECLKIDSVLKEIQLVTEIKG